MRLPWKSSPPTDERRERRSAGGGYSDAVVAAIEAQAAQKVADVSSTAAIESVAGLLSRTFAGATVQGRTLGTGGHQSSVVGTGREKHFARRG